jgi:hypothetical protein
MLCVLDMGILWGHCIPVWMTFQFRMHLMILHDRRWSSGPIKAWSPAPWIRLEWDSPFQEIWESLLIRGSSNWQGLIVPKSKREGRQDRIKPGVPRTNLIPSGWNPARAGYRPTANKADALPTKLTRLAGIHLPRWCSGQAPLLILIPWNVLVFKEMEIP